MSPPHPLVRPLCAPGACCWGLGSLIPSPLSHPALRLLGLVALTLQATVSALHAVVETHDRASLRAGFQYILGTMYR